MNTASVVKKLSQQWKSEHPFGRKGMIKYIKQNLPNDMSISEDYIKYVRTAINILDRSGMWDRAQKENWTNPQIVKLREDIEKGKLVIQETPIQQSVQQPIQQVVSKPKSNIDIMLDAIKKQKEQNSSQNSSHNIVTKSPKAMDFKTDKYTDDIAATVVQSLTARLTKMKPVSTMQPAQPVQQPIQQTGQITLDIEGEHTIFTEDEFIELLDGKSEEEIKYLESKILKQNLI